MALPSHRRRRLRTLARSSRAPEDAWLAALRDEQPDHRERPGAPTVDLRDGADGDRPDTDAAPQGAALEAGRGRRAESPGDIPARGWKDIAARTLAEARSDHVPLLAAGVAFFALLALVPALVAFVSLYGLLADPADVARHVGELLGAAPTRSRTS